MHARNMDFEAVEPGHARPVRREPAIGTAVELPDTSGYGDEDDITAWIEDFDMSLAPAPERSVAPRKRSKAPWVLAAMAVLIAGVMALGFLALGLVAALAIVLLLPILAYDAGPTAPTFEEVMADSVAPAIELVEEAPEVLAPVVRPERPSPGDDAAADDKSDADLVLMPDPAFDDVSIPEAIRRLKEKVSSGEADTRVGR